MALVCSISGEVPEHPVISPVSKHIFEKRLIEKFISENGTDPITGDSLSESELIELKTTPLTKPRPPSATSIPAILKALQDEWDAVMLHSFTLRQQLQAARQELSHALYQHDAACRVIARLTKEATAAREALATLKPQAGASVTSGQVSHVSGATKIDDTDIVEPAEVGMSDEVLQKLQDKATELTSERRKKGKKAPEDLTPADDLRSFKQIATHPGLHSASVPGILALDLQDQDTSKAITGGMDKTAVVFNKENEQVVATLRGHTKKVTSVIYHPREEIAITASADNTVRVWSIPNSSCAYVIKAHDAAVTGLSLHATGDYVLTCSSDQYWAFSDIQTGKILCKNISDPNASHGLTCAQLHPDGLIFGTGTTDSVVKIWDLKERENVANFPGHSGPITSIAFSENGYYLATSADDSVVKLWDLRKLKNFKTITLDESDEIKSLCFDKSGNYLAVAGSNIQLYVVKQWELLKKLTDHTGLVTSVKFGKSASFIASASLDRNIKYFAR
ncbi:pre-mRNA-processing factor 19-like [Hydractinia symbiolongicarpus]|uniref:pre-mRNA-processing factor 19-like n=1 Tax=Hydractinia symbiolongicarpus TaxID=13093 RepID=UPI00254A6A34|nr:pre-mRNA-processing factor 19-like [Hydractinia symbiolongicarpus]XP_057295666.1 pre-mRNA-processing factor 19-like [Hydractinia symbiolongicarpus]